MRVAVVHEWLESYAGSERVLEQILLQFPEADLFTLVDFLPADCRAFLRGRAVRTSFLQKLPLARRMFRNFLPLMPLAVEQFDLSAYDVVISSHHAVAKGVLTRADQFHVCYVHTPMRYAWDLHHEYLSGFGLRRSLKGLAVRLALHYLRTWDAASANRVDLFVANSHYVARRIAKTYRRRAEVIYPPVDVDAFDLSDAREDYYLAASRLVPYKRIDLVVEAFRQMPGRRLMVVGDGPQLAALRRAAPANVTLLGYQPQDELRRHLQTARALIFAAEEDFGILPVEAQACGTPVLAYGVGGAIETVVEGCSGLFFPRQTAASIVEAVRQFELREDQFSAPQIRANALRFSPQRFRQELAELVEQRGARFRRRLMIPQAGATGSGRRHRARVPK